MSGWYETAFRNYDAALGCLTSIDPMATKYASYSAYHYAGNNPVMFNDPTGADFTVTVPDASKPGYWQVITQKVDEPASSSGSGGYWSGQDWVMKTANMTQDEITEYQKGQAEAAAAAAMAPSDPMMAQGYYAALQSQGPKVYNKWCNCEVSAFDVVAHDPTYQNKEYRRQAQNAIYASLQTQGGARYTGMPFDNKDAYNFINTASRIEGRELAMALLPNGKSFVYPWANNPKFSAKSTSYSYYIKDMIAIVHTHSGDTRVSSGANEDLGISAAYNVPIYAIGVNNVYWGASLKGISPIVANVPLLTTSELINGTGSIDPRTHANLLLNSLPK